MNRFGHVLCGLILVAGSCPDVVAQKRGVVVDSETWRPVSGVSVYTDSVGKRLRGMSTDALGRFSVPVGTRRVRFSHTSYKPLEVVGDALADTVYMTPKNVQLSEIVVRDEEPRWIREALRRFIAARERNYRTVPKTMSYKYATYTYGQNDSVGDYRYTSEGNIMLQPLGSKELSKIAAWENVVYSRDSAATGDFLNLRRMLQEDIVNEIDNRFIKEHRYWQNTDYTDADSNVVQIKFRSKKFKLDEGYLVIDTLRNVILEGFRRSGRDYNLKRLTSASARNSLTLFGVRYPVFDIEKRYLYVGDGGIFYPKESSCVVKRASTYKDNHWNFDTQASVSYGDTLYPERGEWADLYGIYYLKMIGTQSDRDHDDCVNDLPFTFINPYADAAE
ncbi:MAG: carboxypeptidase-like regulatory domain-containing protein [Muribaculaceae bacterium]